MKPLQPPQQHQPQLEFLQPLQCRHLHLQYQLLQEMLQVMLKEARLHLQTHLLQGSYSYGIYDALSPPL